VKIKILTGIALFMCIAFSNAQELGVRFGSFAENGVAVDAVFDFEGKRIHADASFGKDYLRVNSIYDFIHKPLGGEENFYWYAGAGATLGLPLKSGVDFDLGAVGELGLEYQFEGAPIVLGLDYRPTFIIIEETDFDFVTFGLNVRYVF
jgi:hypothetical protein